MRSELSAIPLKGAKQLPVTVIHNSRRILGVKIDQHAGTTGNGFSASSSCLSPGGIPSNPSSPGGPAPDHLIHRLWKKSPYCKDSPKHGVIVRVNGRWVHEKDRGF